MKSIMSVLLVWGAVLLLSTFTGCSGTSKQKVTEKQQKTYSEIHDATLKLVSDPDRAQTVMKLVDEQLQIISQYQKEQKNFMKELIALDVNYDSTDEDYYKVIAAQDKKIAEYQKSALAIHDQIMKSLTVEEFQKLKSVRDEAIEAYLLSLQ